MDNTTAPKSPLVQFHNVSFSYGEHRRALRGITLDIERGAFTCIVGANGSGKSTLAKHVNALLVPDEGSVSAFGLDTREPDHATRIRMRTGFVFQNPDNQIVASRVTDEVAFGPENLGLSREEIDARVDRALARLGMGDFADRDVNTLSGGQKQRVALAGALAMEPELLVLDEPGAMLDARGRRELLEILHRLNDEGMTIMLVTHFIEDALGASQVIVLREGVIALAGAPREVLTQHDELHDMGLRTPFAVEVACALRENGVNVGDCLTDDELASAICKAAATRDNGRDESRPYDAPATQTQGHDSPDGRSTRQQARYISFDHVTFSYDGAQNALDDVSLQIARDEIVGVIGPMGSGKSTLTQLMNALLVPTSGTVCVDGHDTTVRSARKDVRQRVGLVFQYPETQLFASTVYEDIAFGPKNLGLSKPEIDTRVRQAMERVGLDFDTFSQRSPFKLSGGQQRLVALAGILALEPAVLVFDEPAAGLDPAGVDRMYALITQLHAQGTGIVMVSHDMDEVARVCTRVVVVCGGHVVQNAGTREVFAPKNSAQLDTWGLAFPHATHMAHSLQVAGLPIVGSCLTSEELVAELCDAHGIL